MEMIHVKGNTFCIDTGMTYVPFYKINDKEIVMLDSGWAKGEREGIDSIIEENNFTVAGIICTHFHMDHVSNCGYLKKKFNCQIAMPAYEAFICDSATNLKMYYSTQTMTDVKEYYGQGIFKTDIMISKDETEIIMNDNKFKILQIPGHSPAHIGIITPDDVAYVADSLISYEVMAGAKMPYAYILSEDLASKNKLYNLNCSKYIVAHKGIYSQITQLIEDNIVFYKSRARGVYSVIKKPMTVDDILKACVEKFQINVKTNYKYNFMQRMLRSYVEYLDEIGMIKLEVKDGFQKYSRTDDNMSGEKIME